MTTLDKNIEDIIQRLSLNQQLLGEQYSHKRIDELQFDSRDSDYRDEATQALKTLFSNLVDSIIGEDEIPPSMKTPDGNSLVPDYIAEERTFLKREQRQRKLKILGGGSE